MGENICKPHLSDKGLVSRMDKELLKLNNKKMRKWAKDMKGHFIEQEKQMANKHMERCTKSLTTREIKLKTTITYHYTLVRMAK